MFFLNLSIFYPLYISSMARKKSNIGCKIKDNSRTHLTDHNLQQIYELYSNMTVCISLDVVLR